MNNLPPNDSWNMIVPNRVFEEIQRQLKVLTESKVEQDEKINNFAKTLLKKDEEIVEIRSELQAVKADNISLSKKSEIQKLKIDNLTESNKELTKQNQDFRKQLDKMQSICIEFEKKQIVLQNIIKTLENEKAELKNQKDQIIENNEQLYFSFESRFKKITEEKKEKEREIEKLQKEIEELKQAKQKIETDNCEKNKNLFAEKERLNEKNTKLSTENEGLLTKTAKLTTENKDLLTKTAKLTTENKDLHTKTVKLTTEKEKIEKKLEQANQNIEAFKTQIDESKNQNVDKAQLKNLMESFCRDINLTNSKEVQDWCTSFVQLYQVNQEENLELLDMMNRFQQKIERLNQKVSPFSARNLAIDSLSSIVGYVLRNIVKCR